MRATQVLIGVLVLVILGAGLGLSIASWSHEEVQTCTARAVLRAALGGGS